LIDEKYKRHNDEYDRASIASNRSRRANRVVMSPTKSSGIGVLQESKANNYEDTFEEYAESIHTDIDIEEDIQEIKSEIREDEIADYGADFESFNQSDQENDSSLSQDQNLSNLKKQTQAIRSMRLENSAAIAIRRNIEKFKKDVDRKVKMLSNSNKLLEYLKLAEKEYSTQADVSFHRKFIVKAS
jgi:hypothetical protein